jgi:hypothetical protein
MLRRDCASSAVGAFLEISGSEPATSDAFQFFVSVTHLNAPSSNVWNGRGRPHSHVGSSAMPRATPRNFAFEVEHIQSMHRAFEAVCARLELSTGTGDRLTELVASRIIALAVAGEWNAERLTAVKIGALSPSLREDYERIRAVAETTLAITEPDWVATAQHEQLRQVANHLIDPATAN